MIVKRFFQGLVIGALLVAIAVLKVRNAFKAAFGGSDLVKDLDFTWAAVYAGVAVVGSLTVAMAAFAATIVVTAAALAALLAVAALPFIALYRGYQLIASIDWVASGKAIAAGIASGIKSGAQWVIDAIKGLGSKAVAAFRDFFDMHSPSRLAARVALDIPRGMAAGITAGTGTVEAATRSVSAAAVPDVEAPAAPGAAGRGSVSIQIGSLNVVANSSEPTDIGAAVEREIREALERVAVAVGAVA